MLLAGNLDVDFLVSAIAFLLSLGDDILYITQNKQKHALEKEGLGFIYNTIYVAEKLLEMKRKQTD